jgi:hypothetical protein
MKHTRTTLTLLTFALALTPASAQGWMTPATATTSNTAVAYQQPGQSTATVQRADGTKFIQPISLDLLPYGTQEVSPNTYMINNYENTGVTVMIYAQAPLRIATYAEMMTFQAQYGQMMRQLAGKSPPQVQQAVNPMPAQQYQGQGYGPVQAVQPTLYQAVQPAQYQPVQAMPPAPYQPVQYQPVQAAAPAPVQPAPYPPVQTPTPAPAVPVFTPAQVVPQYAPPAQPQPVQNPPAAPVAPAFAFPNTPVQAPVAQQPQAPQPVAQLAMQPTQAEPVAQQPAPAVQVAAQPRTQPASSPLPDFIKGNFNARTMKDGSIQITYSLVNRSRTTTARLDPQTLRLNQGGSYLAARLDARDSSGEPTVIPPSSGEIGTISFHTATTGPATPITLDWAVQDLTNNVSYPVRYTWTPSATTATLAPGH